MNLNEKIQKLRKDNNLSQEQLAEKLNVSRQSVSKWESGLSYPEMEKLLQMCKIFDVSLEDLTNEKNVIENNSSKEKKPVNEFVAEFQEIINKSVKMFSSMKGTEILKMLIVMFLVCLGISLLRIPINYIVKIGIELFENFGSFPGNVLSGIWHFILEAIFVILGFMIFFFVYKIEYLDKFRENKEKPVNNQQEEIDDIEIKEGVETKSEPVKKEVIIKKKDSSILGLFGKIILIVLKIFTFFFALPFIAAFVGFIISLVVCIWLAIKGIIFFGPIILILSCIIGISILLELLFNFVGSKKVNVKKLFIEFLTALGLLGIGIGATMIEITNYKFINGIPENYELINKTETIKYNKNLVILNNHNIEYIVDESLRDNIKVEVNYYKGLSTPKIEISNDHLQVWSMDDEFNFDVLNNIFDDLRKKKVYNYVGLTKYHLKVYASSKNIEELKNNIIETEQTKNYYEEQLDYYDQRIEELEDTIYDLNDKLEDKQEELDESNNKLQEYKNNISSLLEE